MKALKSKLAQELQKANIRIPLTNNAKFAFNGKEYVVRYVPRAQ